MSSASFVLSSVLAFSKIHRYELKECQVYINVVQLPNASEIELKVRMHFKHIFWLVLWCTTPISDII